MIPGSLWLVGCGNMGGAMLGRWIGEGLDPATITVIDPGAPMVPQGVSVRADLPAGPAPEVLVLAIKPQHLADFSAGLAAWQGRAPQVLSILAGVDAATISARLRATDVVRAMPNLPVGIGKGVVALFSDAADSALRARVEALSRPLGHVEWIDEECLFDAVTALSGSGPGFLFRFIDSLAAAGEAIGLPGGLSARLALATVEGAAILAAQSTLSPAALADRVASKGGSTREGLNVLDADSELTELLTQTLAAARRRNAELAAQNS